MTSKKSKMLPDNEVTISRTRKFRTQYNSHEFPKYYEKNILPSLTIPDQSYTIAEIIDRFTRGLNFEGIRVPIYSDEDFPDIRNLDISEIDEIRRANQKNQNELRQRLNEEEKLRKKKIRDEYIQKERDLARINRNESADQGSTDQDTRAQG